MRKLVQYSRFGMVVGSVAVIILLFGLGLWAEIPGFRPDSEARVESFQPTGSTDPNTNITIRFTNDLVEADSLHRPVRTIPVTFEPPIPGLARWTEPHTLMIYPDQPLLPATQYVARIKSDTGYAHGNSIKDKRKFRFHTPPLSVTAVRYHAQRIYDSKNQARLLINIEFNYPVSRARLLDEVSIQGDQNATASTLSLTTADTSEVDHPAPDQSLRHLLVTEPFDLKGQDQRYRLNINKGLRCISCTDGLSHKYEKIMSVPRSPRMELRVESVAPVRAGSQGMIEVSLSTPVPANEARDFIEVDPPVKFTLERRWRGILLRGHFQPQSVYTVSIKAGLISEEGTLLERSFSTKVQMGDLEPSLSFTSPGIYLPREGSQLLELETVNIGTLSIEVEQMFANNLVTFLASGSGRYTRRGGRSDIYGRNIFVRDFPLKEQLNTKMTSSVDVGGIIDDSLRGVFAVAARKKSSRWISDFRLVMLTDIGILARMSGDYLMVWANSLSQTEPISKAIVKLFSRNNQLLAESRTNKDGVAVCGDIADQIKGFRPFLITVEKDGDLAYLRLDNSLLPLSDFDVDGRPYLTTGYESFLHTDRGVYRPGETAHLVNYVRQAGVTLPEPFPYLVKISDPRGRKFREYRMNAGPPMSELDIDLPPSLPTGRYTATAHLADEYLIGQTDFLVEEFVPDRIKVTVSTDKDDYAAGEELAIDVIGRMLYGAPAANHKVSCELVLTARNFQPPGYSTYSFADPARKFAQKRNKLPDSILSDSGAITYRHKLASGLKPPAQLSAQVWATVSETGGRAVGAVHEFVVNPYQRYLGLKTDLDGYAEVHQPVTAHLVALYHDGQPTRADSVVMRFSRLVYNTMLQRRPDGSYRFVSEETEEIIDSLQLTVGIQGNSLSFTPQDYGRYQITATDTNGEHSAAVRFYASGWGRVPWSMAQPDRLDLDLDCTQYTPGSIAKLQVRAPFSGRLLVTVENDNVQRYFTVDLPDNTADIDIPIEFDYSPNVYITGTLIRPADQIAKHTPARAFGVVPLIVNTPGKRLTVQVEAPEEIRPNSILPIRVVTDGSPGTRMVIAAVDAGVLQLTSFHTPDPYDFFYGKRRPGLRPYDLYSQVYPETEQAESHLSPPGGVANSRRRQHLNPFAARRIEIVSLWSGIVAADSTGDATVDFSVPQFNGQLILMAVACDNDRFGSGESAVLVRDKIIIQESFPRFVAPGDIVDGLVTIFNGTDSTAVISVSCQLAGNAALLSESNKQIMLKSNSEGAVKFRFQASPSPGTIAVTIEAESGSEQSRSAFELSNRPAQPLTVEFGSGAVTADSSVSFTLPDTWIDGTDKYLLRTSSLAALRVARNIESLLQYPYGCLEQTTSRLFPLLYFDDLAKVVRPELVGGKGHEYFIAEGIDRLLRFQRDDGSFSYWPGGQRLHNWSAIYAGHFLVKAEKAGYEVDSGARKRLLKFLSKIARGKNYVDIKTEHRVYACYVLAEAGRLDRKLVNYLTGMNTDVLPAYSRYQVAAALALTGDIERARELVPFDIQPATFEPDDGHNFASGVRTNAILLDLLLDVEPGNPSVYALAKSLLDNARLNRWYNTQATAFALAALGRFFADTEPSDFTGQLTIEGLDPISFDTADFSLSRDDLAGRTVNLRIDGQGICFYYWQASGVPSSPTPREYQRGIKIKREYFDAFGSPADMSNVKLGTQLVGHISVQSLDRPLSNVVISDLLPAGLEIENQRLATTAQAPWIPARVHTPDYQDIRDDRLLLFVNLRRGRAMNFYYNLRAIAVGEYTVPPVMTECMYNPLVAGASSSGILTVTAE